MIDITGGEVIVNAGNDGINASKIGVHESEEDEKEKQRKERESRENQEGHNDADQMEDVDNDQVEYIDESETLETYEVSVSDNEDCISDEETSITTMEVPTEAVITDTTSTGLRKEL